jgi:acetyl esterase
MIVSPQRRDIEYSRAGGQSLRLDLFRPDGPGPFPAAILAHGGGWVAGDRARNLEPLFAPLVAAGFACLPVSYRLATDIAMLGAGIDDVAEAVRFARANAADLGIDPARIVLIGESAGGQLAAMAALRDPSLAVQSVVAFYAPWDLERIASQSMYLPEPYRKALSLVRHLSPIHHVRAGAPPFLLIHGDNDMLVPFEQSREMCRAVRRVGGQADLIAVRGGGHGVRRWEAAGLTGYKRLMTDWMRRTVEAAAGSR